MDGIRESIDFGDRRSWRKRLKHFATLHLRQIPCLHGVLKSIRCWRRSRYQTLGQEDGEEVVEDQKQYVNLTFGQALMKVALVFMIGITVVCVMTTSNDSDEDWANQSKEDWEAAQFRENAPIALYIGAFELLVCGSCAMTAAVMYQRRWHQLKHPSEFSEVMQKFYLQVHLEKDPGMKDIQFYGIGFRPSSDGHECLIVEDIRRGSLLDQWNKGAFNKSPEELVEEALGEDSVKPVVEGAEAAPDGAETSNTTTGKTPQVMPGSAIVAVNEVSGDVGLMQQQLHAKSKVTLWIANEFLNPFEQDDGGILMAQPAVNFGERELEQVEGTVQPTAIGAVQSFGTAGSTLPALPNPRCACLAMEDEEANVLTRWTVCGIMFGWVTMLPVLLMQPHEERPRQQLFRQYLLKPMILMLPFTMLLWVLDCVQIIFMFKIIHPFWYYMFCHAICPAVTVWYLFQLQAADQRLALDQRKSRAIEAAAEIPMVIEDPSPVLLKELITINPVAMIWLGACAALPIVMCSLLTPFETKRAQHAQGFVNVIYGPLSLLQMLGLYIVYHLRFTDMPRMYVVGIGFLTTLPCIFIWCLCLFCANRFAKQDLLLVEEQRLARAKARIQKHQASGSELSDLASAGSSAPAAGSIPVPLVDCAEALTKEYELIYTA